MRFLGGLGSLGPQGWTLSRHQKGVGPANKPTFFIFFPLLSFFSFPPPPPLSSSFLLSLRNRKEFLIAKCRLTQHRPYLMQHWWDIAWVARAPTWKKNGRGKGCARARVWRRDGIVRNERMESCQKKKILCGPTGVVTATPLWGESSRLKFLPALMAAVINPCCLEAVEPHNNKGLVTETKQPILKFMKFGHVHVAELRSDDLTRCASDQTFAHIRPPSPHIHISYN